MKRSIGLAALGLLVACGSPRVVKTALHGDLPALKQEIARSQSAGELRGRQVERLARAVAGREVRSATGEAGVRRLRQVEPCAAALVPVLEDRAGHLDDIGAEATRQLFLRGRRSPARLVRRYADAESGAWRAVAARAALAPEYGELRRRMILDPDERVRRAALEAALEARDADDLGPVLEASRLDPDMTNRALATQVVGALGGERAVLALADRWERASQTERRAILVAWAEPAAYAAGGERQLVRVLEGERGMLALVAGALLVERGGEARGGATARLTQAIAEGTTEERRFAISAALRETPDVRQALNLAAKQGEPRVRVFALARLLDAGDVSARTELRKLSAVNDEVGLQARVALSAARDDSVRAALEKQLTAPGARRRRLAADGLINLGAWSAVAGALGDDDPAVRTSVACRVIQARSTAVAEP